MNSCGREKEQRSIDSERQTETVESETNREKIDSLNTNAAEIVEVGARPSFFLFSSRPLHDTPM